MKFTRTVASVLLASISLTAHAGNPRPTFADVEYGEHERNKLDFWQKKSSKPTPLIIFFHGGGFKMGDKSDIQHFLRVDECLAKGASVATVNYPFLQHTGNDYRAIMKHCEKASEFLLTKAKEWNIDEKRIGAAGCSAGALISEWLGCNTKDISVLGIFLQPYGAEALVLRRLNKDFPPTIIYQSSGPDDQVHHPKHAQTLKDACDNKDVTCELWGSKKSGLPQLPGGTKPIEAVLEFFFKQWEEKEGPAPRAAKTSKNRLETVETDETREIRTWTARSGARIEARIIKEAAGTVVLREEGGRSMKISSRKLSKADQEYIQSLK
jgi:predicted esterase